MSVIFQLTPSPKHGQNILTVGEAIEGTSLEPFRGPGADARATLAARADAGITLLADAERSSRGFEFNFEHGHYAVCVFSPSTPTDWQIALEFVRDLAVRLDATITDDQDRTHTVDSILDVPHMDDIMFGLQGVDGQAKRSGLAVMGGMRRPWHLDAEMTGAILAAEDPAREFERRFREVQSIVAADGVQQPADHEGEWIMQYFIADGVPMVLPMQTPFPGPALRQTLQGRTVDMWLASLYLKAASESGTPRYELARAIPWQQFLDRLPESKRHPIDGYSMYMEPLTRDEILAFAGK